MAVPRILGLFSVSVSTPLATLVWESSVMFLFEDLQWLRPFFAWTVGGLLIWLVASIPAYLLYGIAGRVLEALTRWIERLRAGISEGRDSRISRLEAVRREWLNSERVESVDLARYNAWMLACMEKAAALDRISRNIEQSRKLASEAQRALTDVSRRFGRLGQVWESFPGLSSVDELSRHTQKHRVAGLNLWLSLLVAVPVLAVNAFLSSMVFRDLLPRLPSVFGRALPLEYGVAVIVTLMEIGLGLLHGAAGQKKENDHRQLRPAQLFISLLALLMVFLEGVFYAQFAGEGEGFLIPASGGAVIPFGTGFGMLGLVMAGVLFFLGRLTYQSAVELRTYGTAKVLARHVRKLQQAGGDWDHLLTDLKTRSGELSERLSRLGEFIDDRGKEISSTVDAAVCQVGDLLIVPPDWAAPTGRALSRPELDETVSQLWVWSVLAAVALISTVSLLSFGLGRVFDGVEARIVVTASLGVSALLIGAGFGWGIRVRKSSAETLGIGSAWYRGLLEPALTSGIVLTVWLVVGWRDFDDPVVVAVWALALPLFALTVLAGKEIALAAGAIAVLIASLQATLRTLTEILGIGAIVIAKAFVVVTMFCLEVLAAPVYLLLGRRPANAAL